MYSVEILENKQDVIARDTIRDIDDLEAFLSNFIVVYEIHRSSHDDVWKLLRGFWGAPRFETSAYSDGYDTRFYLKFRRK